MSARSVLWVDLRTSPAAPDLCSSLPRSYRAQRVRVISQVLQAVKNWLPWAVCFEYDRPDARGLETLVEVKNQYSALPIVMLTEQHSQALADWAFRSCVWDYLVKPLSVRDLCNCLASIYRAAPRGGSSRLAQSLPPTANLNVDHSRINRPSTVAPAMSYVEANYAERIRMATAAKLCNLSPFQFSRQFKKENGLTFRDFVVKLRINRAAQLMKESGASVTEAAFVVGFNDLSYFARMFRRQIGVPPSHYRVESEPRQLRLFPENEAGRPAKQDTTSHSARNS